MLQIFGRIAQEMSWINPFRDCSDSLELSGVGAGLAALAAYVGTLQLLRFRRMHQIQAMDVIADPSAIYRQLSMLEFPFTVSKSIEFVFFRIYGIPSISKLLRKTSQFKTSAGKRFDDTDFLMREYSENTPETERSQKAVQRMNAIHGMYANQISNGDMLYTLSLFVTEPARWIDRYEWRRITDAEKAALLGHFIMLGKLMGIKGMHDWKTWDDVCAFQKTYEEKHLAYDSANNSMAESTMGLFLSAAPASARRILKWVVFTLMDPALLKALGFPLAPRLLRWMVNGIIILRAKFVRYFLPPRPDFLASRRTPTEACNHDSAVSAQGNRGALYKPCFSSFNDTSLGCMFYNNGYRIEELGTGACPAGRLMKDFPKYSGKGGGGSEAW